MRNKFSSIVALICILVYIAALGFAAFRIYASLTERLGIAEREFNRIADIASSTGAPQFMTEAFQETMRKAVRESRTLEAVIISDSYGGEHAFERETGGAVVWSGYSPQFKARFGLSRDRLSAPLFIPGLRNINIRAAADYIDRDSFTTILKYTLLAVLAALSLAFFTLILEISLGKTPAREAYPRRRPAKEPPPPSRPPAQAAPGEPEDEEPAFGDEELEDEPAFGEDEEPAFAMLEDAEEEPADAGGPPVTVEDLDIPAAEEPAETEEEAFVPEEIEEESPAKPQGLYSPYGNIGWEEYTKDRLEAELHRCASFDQDLALLFMESKDTGTIDEKTYKQFADAAVRFFTNRDLIFERGRRGIAVIFPNADLDQGFAKAEEFHSRALDDLSGLFTSKTDLCIGLSSRSGRLINGDRLFLEASQALEKALADPASPIVAFKSDPEKYRAFIGKRGSKSRPAGRL